MGTTLSIFNVTVGKFGHMSAFKEEEIKLLAPLPVARSSDVVSALTAYVPVEIPSALARRWSARRRAVHQWLIRPFLLKLEGVKSSSSARVLVSGDFCCFRFVSFFFFAQDILLQYEPEFYVDAVNQLTSYLRKYFDSGLSETEKTSLRNAMSAVFHDSTLFERNGRLTAGLTFEDAARMLDQGLLFLSKHTFTDNAIMFSICEPAMTHALHRFFATAEANVPPSPSLPADAKTSSAPLYPLLRLQLDKFRALEFGGGFRFERLFAVVLMLASGSLECDRLTPLPRANALFGELAKQDPTLWIYALATPRCSDGQVESAQSSIVSDSKRATAPSDSDSVGSSSADDGLPSGKHLKLVAGKQQPGAVGSSSTTRATQPSSTATRTKRKRASPANSAQPAQPAPSLISGLLRDSQPVCFLDHVQQRCTDSINLPDVHAGRDLSAFVQRIPLPLLPDDAVAHCGLFSTSSTESKSTIRERKLVNRYADLPETRSLGAQLKLVKSLCGKELDHAAATVSVDNAYSVKGSSAADRARVRNIRQSNTDLGNFEIGLLVVGGHVTNRQLSTSQRHKLFRCIVLDTSSVPAFEQGIRRLAGI